MISEAASQTSVKNNTKKWLIANSSEDKVRSKIALAALIMMCKDSQFPTYSHLRGILSLKLCIW